VAGGAIWKGSIHFGGVEVPVKLRLAVKEERLQFHLLHRPDQVRLQQQMVCTLENLPVPKEEQVKGFEVEENRYILVDPEELEQAEPESSRRIEVHEFVKAREIEPIFLERLYFLEPETPARGYRALAAGLEELEAAGICTWTMRKRAYFGALQAREKVLRLQILRYAFEVIPAQALDLEEFSLTEKEIKIGCDLIGQLTEPFEPEKFGNEHQRKLLELIDKKARQEKIVLLRPKRLKPTAPGRLLEALEASLKQVA
jgi:DNA end-binding protein Ku